MSYTVGTDFYIVSQPITMYALGMLAKGHGYTDAICWTFISSAFLPKHMPWGLRPTCHLTYLDLYDNMEQKDNPFAKQIFIKCMIIFSYVRQLSHD